MWRVNYHNHWVYFQLLSETLRLTLSHPASLNSFKVSGCGIKCPWFDPIIAGCYTGVYFWTLNQMTHWEKHLMKDYQKDFRHLRCFLFLVREDVFSLPVLCCWQQRRMCVMKGGGSSESKCKDGILTLSKECSEEVEEWRAPVTFKEITSEQHQRRNLAFGICCPSSQNKTRPLGGQRSGRTESVQLPSTHQGVTGLAWWGWEGAQWRLQRVVNSFIPARKVFVRARSEEKVGMSGYKAKGVCEASLFWHVKWSHTTHILMCTHEDCLLSVSPAHSLSRTHRHTHSLWSQVAGYEPTWWLIVNKSSDKPYF